MGVVLGVMEWDIDTSGGVVYERRAGDLVMFDMDVHRDVLIQISPWGRTVGAI